MNCFLLKEAVSGRLGGVGDDRDFFIYIYNFISFVLLFSF